MSEPDVTLTDYGLTVLCLWLAHKVYQFKSDSSLMANLWVFFYLSLAFSALTGGTVHGFFGDEASIGYKILWPATMLGVGVTTSVIWLIVGALLSGIKHLKFWMIFSLIDFVIYSSIALFITDNFRVVVLNYLPAILTLFVVCFRNFIKTRSESFKLLSKGIVISLVAAFIQQAKIAIHPVYFTHHSVYHVIQAFGLWIIFKGVVAFIKLERISK